MPDSLAESQIQSRVFFSYTGRHVAVTPENRLTRHLANGRIILDSSKPSESFSTGDRETRLICLSGEVTVFVENEEIQLENSTRCTFRATLRSPSQHTRAWI